MKILGIHHDSVVDGSGIRDVIFFARCSHHCKGCFSPETWTDKYAYDLELNDIISEIDFRNDITISGGDPFNILNREDLLKLTNYLKNEKKKNIWCYTGYTYEELLSDDLCLSILKNIDVLVDGEFKEDLKDLSLYFRGSSNQRIIDVQKSLKEGYAICKQF